MRLLLILQILLIKLWLLEIWDMRCFDWLLIFQTSRSPKAAGRFCSVHLLSVETSFDKHRVFLPSCGFKTFLEPEVFFYQNNYYLLLCFGIISHFLYNSFLKRYNCFSFSILAAFVKVKNNFSCRQLMNEIGEILDKPNQLQISR